MSETEVVDPAADIVDMEPAACFGEWEAGFKECEEACEIRDKCKKHTLSAPKVPARPEPLSSEEELPDMEPLAFLIESLKGRYDLEPTKEKTKKGDDVTILNCRKDGKDVIQIRIGKSGRCLMRVPSKDVMLQLGELESVRQVSNLFKAILVV